MSFLIIITRPLPEITRHIHHPIRTGIIKGLITVTDGAVIVPHRRGLTTLAHNAFKYIPAGIKICPVSFDGVTPRIGALIHAAGSLLPFHLRGQPRAHRIAISIGAKPGDQCNRVVFITRQRGHFSILHHQAGAWILNGIMQVIPGINQLFVLVPVKRFTRVIAQNFPILQFQIT